MGKLLEELKRRKVFRVAAVYAVVAWVLIQVADTVLPALQMPQWTVSFVTVLFIFGFFPTLIAAWAYEITPEGVKPESGVQPQTQIPSAQSQRLNYAIFALVLLAVGFQISDRFLTTDDPVPTRAEQSTQLARFSLRIPQDEYFHPARGDFDLSDDGSTFVYTGVAAGDQSISQLWVRQWDGSSGKPLSGATYTNRPKISPDGQRVAFGSQGSLMLASIEGGNPRVLVETASTSGPVPNWSPDGLWIYFSNFENGISRLAASGGEEEVLTLVDTGIGDVSHVFVDVLAEERIVYTVVGVNGSRVQAANLETGEVKDLIPGGYPIYSPTGHLLFQAGNEPTLMAAPFDALALELTGPAVVLAEGLLPAGSGRANVAISNTGRLIYRTGDSALGAGSPMWVDRDGTAIEIDPGWQTYAGGASSSLALSPSGDRLVISLSEIGDVTSQDLWIKRLDDGPLSRVTFTSELNTNYHPSWSPDGQYLLYMFGLNNFPSLWSRRADGAGEASLLLERPARIYEAFYSSDSSWLVFREQTDSHNIFALQTTTDAEPIPLVVNDEFNSVSPTLSPDDKWLAYASDETGRYEIYVRPFPDTDSGRWQVSNNGGIEPVWAHSGKELFYRTGNQEMVSVEINAGATFDWVDQDILFSTAGYRTGVRHPAYDISPDDQRFVMVKYDPIDNTELIMVENWFEELKRLAQPDTQ